AATRAGLVQVAAGSIGRALDIAKHDGLSLLSQFLTIAGGEPIDWPAARALGRGESERPERIHGEKKLIQRLARAGRLEQLLEVWEKVTHLFARSDGANLDRRLTVISALNTVSAAL